MDITDSNCKQEIPITSPKSLSVLDGHCITRILRYIPEWSDKSNFLSVNHEWNDIGLKWMTFGEHFLRKIAINCSNSTLEKLLKNENEAFGEYQINPLPIMCRREATLNMILRSECSEEIQQGLFDDHDNHVEAIKLLVESGKFNSYWALESCITTPGISIMVAALLVDQAGADPSVQGNAALTNAATSNNPHLVDYLLKHDRVCLENEMQEPEALRTKYLHSPTILNMLIEDERIDVNRHAIKIFEDSITPESWRPQIATALVNNSRVKLPTKFISRINEMRNLHRYNAKQHTTLEGIKKRIHRRVQAESRVN